MLMMQCADPNTLPAPSRLHQLEQSLSLPSPPFPPCLLRKPLASFHFLFLRRLNCMLFFFPFFFLLLLPFPLPALHRVNLTHKPSMSSCFHFSTYHLYPSEKKKTYCLIERYAIKVARNQKAKMLSRVVQKCQRYKG